MKTVDIIINDRKYEMEIPKWAQDKIAAIITLTIRENVQKGRLPDIDYVGMPFAISIEQVICDDLEEHTQVIKECLSCPDD